MVASSDPGGASQPCVRIMKHATSEWDGIVPFEGLATDEEVRDSDLIGACARPTPSSVTLHS